MNQGLIPRRYAKALFELASENGADKSLYDAMRRLVAAFAADSALHKAVANPYVSLADKKLLIITAAAPDVVAQGLLADLIQLLERNHRMEFFQSIALAFNALYRDANKIFSVQIASAATLQPGELKRIQSLVLKHLPQNSTAEFSQILNPELIGGFTVCIDNELLDASVANELKQLRLKLLSH